jgi:hypothetical protein
MRTVVYSGLMCTCVAAAPASAQLWDTGPWDGTDGRSSDRATPAVRPQTRAADDFVLAAGNGQGYTISGLKGRSLARIYTGGFAEIYADAGGVPAAAPLYTLSQSGVQVLQTGVFGQYDLLQFTFNTAGVQLAPGRYWVAVVCNVSGQAAPNDGYGFFGTGGSQTVQGLQGHYRIEGGAWTPSVAAFGFPTDFSFRVDGTQLPAACYANCDSSTLLPVLNILDFICFQNKFAQGNTYANCDGSTTPPVLNVADFTCFMNRYIQGCP